MKANCSALNAIFYLASIAFLFASCRKEAIQAGTLEPGATVSSHRPQAIAKTNDLVLQTFTRNGRTYHFFYAPNGQVDSIVVTGDYPYVYRAWYKGAQLDSVILIDKGRIVSTHRNFHYKGNFIVGYDYFDRIDKIPFPWSGSVKYDAENRITSVDRTFQGSVQHHGEWTYNASNDMITMLGFGSDDGSFTHDSMLNPLHFVPDLFVLFVEESYIWEYNFSLHNILSKTIPGRPTITFVNQYNDAGQLMRSTSSDRLLRFSYTYD